MKKIRTWLIALLILVAFLAPSPLFKTGDSNSQQESAPQVGARISTTPTPRPETRRTQQAQNNENSSESDRITIDEFMAQYGGDEWRAQHPDVTPRPQSSAQPSLQPRVQPSIQPSVQPSVNYILNMNTYKFHYPYCSSVGQMNESNKWYFTGTRDEAIAMGYVPCGRCNP